MCPQKWYQISTACFAIYKSVRNQGIYMKNFNISIILLLISISVFSKDDLRTQKMEVALQLNSTKEQALKMHEKLDALFDTLVAKGPLKNEKAKLISAFRKDYEKAVDEYLGIDSLEYSFALFFSEHATMDQLKNHQEFYNTEIGKKVRKNLNSGRNANAGMSADEFSELIKSYEKYGFFELIKIMSKVMPLYQKSLESKVNKLRIEYRVLEAEYNLKKDDF